MSTWNNIIYLEINFSKFLYNFLKFLIIKLILNTHNILKTKKDAICLQGLRYNNPR